MKDCEHKDFSAEVDVTRMEDSGRFQADVRIKCTECDLPFRFIGLPVGLDLNGAAVSMDATEARLAIGPKGEVMPAVDGAPQGFSMRIDGDAASLQAIRINKLESDIATLRLAIIAARELAMEVDASALMLRDAGFVGTADSIESKIKRFKHFDADAPAFIGSYCPVCAHEFEMGQPPYFQVDEGGTAHDGERPVHWHRGTQSCPNCGSTWPYEDSD